MFLLLPFQGVVYIYDTYGVALGCVLIGLSARFGRIFMSH